MNSVLVRVRFVFRAEISRDGKVDSHFVVVDQGGLSVNGRGSRIKDVARPEDPGTVGAQERVEVFVQLAMQAHVESHCDGLTNEC